MRDHDVTIDRSVSPAAITFAETFNAAVAMVDRHLDEGRGEKIAIETETDKISYAALADNVNCYANVLTGLGLGRGDRVLMVVQDCPEFFHLFWGAVKAGIIPVPLNVILRAADYEKIIESSGAAALFYSERFGEEIEPAVNACGVRHAMPVDGSEFRQLVSGASGTFDAVATTAMEDCFWLYSSGSTGMPKAVVHRHRDLVVVAQRFNVDWLGLREDDVCFSAAKLFFAYGVGNALTAPLWAGATIVLHTERPLPENMFKVIGQHRPTLFFCVPTLYASMLAIYDQTKPDMSSLRHCVSAGEPLPEDLYHRWRAATGLDILDVIGSTEMLHVFIGNRPDDIRPGTCGRPVAGYDIRLVDEDWRDVPEGEMGNLMVRGDSAFRCYWNRPELTTETIIEGWVKTGDTFRRDADGYYICCGRSDDMMKVGGIWCSPVEIEAHLVAHAAVLEAAVVGRADGEGMIKPDAHVVLVDGAMGSDDLAAVLQAHCKQGLAPYKYPRWLTFVDELPKTATGKIQRFRLRTVE